MSGMDAEALEIGQSQFFNSTTKSRERCTARQERHENCEQLLQAKTEKKKTREY
jgi:hypothetical protein